VQQILDLRAEAFGDAWPSESRSRS